MDNLKSILIVLLTIVWYANPVSARESPTDPTISVELEAEKGKYNLIEIERLWELYQDDSKNVLLIDTRQEWEFRTGHISDAVHFSMEPTWFSRLIHRYALAQKLGTDKDLILIFY